MAEINIEQEVAKYEAEFNAFMNQLRQLESQRSTLVQAIAERQGIIAYLNTLKQKKDSHPQKE